jgi:hypothetical protein
MSRRGPNYEARISVPLASAQLPHSAAAARGLLNLLKTCGRMAWIEVTLPAICRTRVARYDWALACDWVLGAAVEKV